MPALKVNNKRPRWIFFLVPIILIALFILQDIFLAPSDKKLFSKISKNDNLMTQLPSCGTKKDLFTSAPADMSKLAALVPLGTTNPSSHVFPIDHMYFWGFNVGDFPQPDINIYSPGDVFVAKVGIIENRTENITEYNLDFSPCREVVARYYHLNSINEKLNKATQEGEKQCSEYSTGGTDYRYCEITPKGLIALKSGELVGKMGGQRGANGDFRVYDQRNTPLAFANMARWEKSDITPFVACPVDYFTSPHKENLENLIGEYDEERFTKRIGQPLCGEVNQDIAGTAQGIWFKPGTPNQAVYTEDEHSSLVHDAINTNKAVFSVGTSMSKSGLNTENYYFDPRPTGTINRDFNRITADGKTYCFEVKEKRGISPLPFVIILQMPTNTTIKLEKINTPNCSSSPTFTNNFTTFER